MKYNYIINVRDNEKLRASFNELTQKVYGFNFIEWYERGQWGDKYIPHVLEDNGKVVSNVSVNLMEFDVSGEKKKYIQLGTVMTDPDYRGQGLNRYIMEKILEEYRGKADGIYLFGNDSVLEYYPRFGFTPIKEYEYSRKVYRENGAITSMGRNAYRIEKMDMSYKGTCDKLYSAITEYDSSVRGNNQNDGFSMCDNLGLYQFWLAAEFKESVYYLPDMGAYIIADLKADTLKIYQMIGKDAIDVDKLAASFGSVSEIKLGFTPAKKEGYDINPHIVEDSTLFIMGDSLKLVETEKMMFPEISHA
ncbi:acetyltransferase (GNAT) family protein [Kineothrix alysoides]|uniref:Acetyltransferase (GNAT) family protein n=1 Tax=Kineothrix alysoides TaxID=1469948 RepID=A0A4R1QWQ8_9FIRM|nr:GNAT family N-acetyltransferase [Kineothrix alysoides]TCL57973.1 acetyltransferase (GNAT) family protein [Kineothrix alysoides]